MSKKTAADGASKSEPASPRTLMKKISSLRAFFEWAGEERQATLVDPVAGLGKRDKALRKAASRSKDNYHPFSTEQLRKIFEPSKYLAFQQPGRLLLGALAWDAPRNASEGNRHTGA